MKNTTTHQEKEKSFQEVKQIMSSTPCSITPRIEQPTPFSEDQEWFGVNADRERRKFNEETGEAS